MKYLLILALTITSGCSFISKKTEIASIENVHGNYCEDINIRKTVLFDTIAVGPVLLPIIPAFLVKPPIFKLTIVDCENNTRYPVVIDSSGYHWLNTSNDCTYKIKVKNEYEYIPLWWGQKPEKPMKCYSFSELNMQNEKK